MAYINSIDGCKDADAKDALAFLLSAKLGSLDDAFQYMDTANRGDSFAFVSWHTGLLVLRIEPWKQKDSAGFNGIDVVLRLLSEPM